MQSRLIYFVLLLMVLSCKKKDSLPKEPVIEFISASPLSLTQFKDSIIIRIKYKDNNGDVGDISADKFSLEVKDSRLAKPDYYHIKPLAPVDHNINIEGELNIKISSLFLLGAGTIETTVLSIRLKDREDHWSNAVQSPVITIQ